MNKIPNRQAICEVLMKHAETDKDIVVLCSDSRGSASLTPFANAYPEQFVEMGIAEQDLVSVCLLYTSLAVGNDALHQLIAHHKVGGGRILIDQKEARAGFDALDHVDSLRGASAGIGGRE